MKRSTRRKTPKINKRTEKFGGYVRISITYPDARFYNAKHHRVS